MSGGITMLTDSPGRLTVHHYRQKYCRRRRGQLQCRLRVVVVLELLCGFLLEVLLATLALAFALPHVMFGLSDLVFPVFQRQ